MTVTRAIRGRNEAARVHYLCRRRGFWRPDVRYWPKADMRLCTARVRFWGKSGHAFAGIPLLRSLLGVKRTSLFATHMSAFDPKRTPAVKLIDALSGWIVNREDNHVVPTKITQRVLLAGAYLADSTLRDGLRFSVDRYVPGPAEEVEQMAPRFDVWHRMIARFETYQFRIESAAIIGIRERFVFEASRPG